MKKALIVLIAAVTSIFTFFMILSLSWSNRLQLNIQNTGQSWLIVLVFIIIGATSFTILTRHFQTQKMDYYIE